MRKCEPEPELQQLLTAPQAAALLAVSRQTLWRMAKAGKLTVYRIGGSTRFAAADMARLQAACVVNSPPV